MSGRILAALILALPAASWSAVSKPSVRVGLGINGAPLVNHLGTHLNVTYPAWAWSAGEFILGAQVAAHFYLPNPSILEQPGVSLVSRSTDFRASLLVGHEFLLLQHLELGLVLFLGPNLRFVDASLNDQQNGIDAVFHDVATTFELGSMLTVGWRFTDTFGVQAVLALPLAVTDSGTVLRGWPVAPPYVGVSARLSF
jgi:hypothetical protein